MTAPQVLRCFTHNGLMWQPRIFDDKFRFLGLLILEAKPLSRCALFALLILWFYFTVSLAPKFSFILVKDWVFGLSLFPFSVSFSY